jgi:type III restriction enzyme
MMQGIAFKEAGRVDTAMANPFFERPVLNSPYAYPSRHWQLDGSGQPTGQTVERRRRAEFITPIPRPRKQRGTPQQRELVFDEGKGLSTEKQQYDPTGNINELRRVADGNEPSRAFLWSKRDPAKDNGA